MEKSIMLLAKFSTFLRSIRFPISLLACIKLTNVFLSEALKFFQFIKINISFFIGTDIVYFYSFSAFISRILSETHLCSKGELMILSTPRCSTEDLMIILLDSVPQEVKMISAGVT
jgi:hypothetical protein